MNDLPKDVRIFWGLFLGGLALYVAFSLLYSPKSVSELPAKARETISIHKRPFGDVIGSLQKGTTITIIGRNEDTTWVVIAYQGEIAWIPSYPLDVNGNPKGLPVNREYLPAPYPTKPPVVCTCTEDFVYYCSDFSTHLEAQRCFSYCMDKVGYDYHHLDGDGDGSACELNP